MLTASGARAWPDKKLVELEVVRELVQLMELPAARAIVDVWPREETRPATPPDVFARNGCGGLVGIEVSELVSEEAIVANVSRPRLRDGSRAPSLLERRRDRLLAATNSSERLQALRRYNEQLWSPSIEELASRLCAMVATKDGKPFAEVGEPYAERWLVIHTSEHLVHWRDLMAAIDAWSPPTLRQLDYVYLLGKHDPWDRACPWHLILTRTP